VFRPFRLGRPTTDFRAPPPFAGRTALGQQEAIPRDSKAAKLARAAAICRIRWLAPFLCLTAWVPP
jgi:hypothetical protein